MPVQTSCPPEIRRALGEAQVRFALAADLDHQRRYGTTWVVVTGERLIALAGEVARAQPKLSEISETRVDELYGAARLVAVIGGQDHVLAYYTRRLVPEFATLCRVINDLIAARPALLPEAQPGADCARCGAPLSERGAPCGLCVPRGQIVRRLVALLVPYRAQAVALTALILLSLACQLTLPYLTKLLMDEVIDGGRRDLLPWLIGGMLGCGALFSAAKVWSGRTVGWLSGRLTADLRARLHGHILRLRMTYLGKRDHGELVSRVMNDTGELQHFLADGLPYLLVQSVQFVVLAAILVSLDPWLALLVFVPVPFLVGGGRWFWSRLVPLFHRRGSRNGSLHSVLGETLHGLKAVKAFTQEGARDTAFGAANERAFATGFGIHRTFVGFSEGMFWVMSIGVALVWLFGSARLSTPAAGETLTRGDLIAFVGYIWMFYGPLQWSTAILNWMTNAFAGAERIFNVLDEPLEKDAPAAVDPGRIVGAVELRDVRFSYERGKEVLKGVSLTVEAGQMIGLVGRSGAGKSTVISLLGRLFEPDSGEVLIDGIPASRIQLARLRRSIGVVMQDPFLFNASIVDNIRFGRPDASFADVVRAARAACAHEFILDKEDGYDTIIGEGGAKLSGGERQRLAIARAILNDPPILILDEATSAVDAETEAAIQLAIGRLVQGRTTIAIAHRLATLRHASRLVVIEDGGVAETGTHEELLAKPDGAFAKLVKLQQENNRLRDEMVAL